MHKCKYAPIHRTLFARLVFETQIVETLSDKLFCAPWSRTLRMFEETHGAKGVSFVRPQLSLHNPLSTFAPLSIPSISRSFNSTTVFSFSPAVSTASVRLPLFPPLPYPFSPSPPFISSPPSILKAKSSAQRFLVHPDLTNQTAPSFKKLIFAVPFLPPFSISLFANAHLSLLLLSPAPAV